MNCLETQKRIRAFLDGTLPDPEMEAFLSHMDTCKDCREELEIYYTVDQALKEDESGFHGGWDGRKESVTQLLRSSSRRVSMRKGLRTLRIVLRAVAGVTAALILLAVLGIFPAWHFWKDDPSAFKMFRRSSKPETVMQTETESTAVLQAVIRSAAVVSTETETITEAQTELFVNGSSRLPESEKEGEHQP